MGITGRLAALLAFISVMALAASADAYDETTVTGGGTISGKVIFNGAVPKKKIIPTKDTDVCGGPREDPLMQVGADKGVQNAVISLEGIAKGKAWPADGKTPVLDNIKCRFDPELQVIRVGALDVVNKDPVLHNSHGYYGKRTAFNLAQPNQDQVIPTELPRPGVVRVDCDAHGWMEGWIYVVENPYYAVTAADGSFTIADVPPGDYKLIAFQPFIGPMEMQVTVAAGQTTESNIELKK
jgi:hypothetical protein